MQGRRHPDRVEHGPRVADHSTQSAHREPPRNLESLIDRDPGPLGASTSCPKIARERLRSSAFRTTREFGPFGLYFGNTRFATASSASVSKATSLPSEL